MARLLLAATLLLLSATVMAQATLTPQVSGVEVRLRGISAVDANVAWASGRGGTVLRTLDGGVNWQVSRVPGAQSLDFRDVEGFDADTAVVLSIGPGDASRIYRTRDGGKTWSLALQNSDPRAFFDCMAFDGQRGWVLGDPVDGAFQVYSTTDAGVSWTLQSAGMPQAMKDEAAFAASGTCIAITPWGQRMVVTGGGGARVLTDDAQATRWVAHDTSMPARVPAAGIFSATAVGADMLLIGGDFENESTGSAALVMPAGDAGMQVSRLPDPRGYRSGAACVGDLQPRCVAVGPTGTDLLVNGRWQALSETGYDAVDLAGNVGWASGDKGRIARIEIAPVP